MSEAKKKNSHYFIPRCRTLREEKKLSQSNLGVSKETVRKIEKKKGVSLKMARAVFYELNNVHGKLLFKDEVFWLKDIDENSYTKAQLIKMLEKKPNTTVYQIEEE